MFETLRVRSSAARCKHWRANQRWCAVSCSTARPLRLPYHLPQLPRESRLEVLLLLWDELDDWLAAARHLLGTLT